MSCRLFAHLPTAIATTLLGLGTSWFLWSRHVNERSKSGKADRGIGLINYSFEC